MARTVFHPVLAVTLHEIRSLMANPSMAAVILFLVAFALMFTDFFHFYADFSAPFLCQLAVCSIGGIGTVCVLAEERERGAERTVLLTGVSRAEMAFGKLLACSIVSELTSFVCAFGVLRDFWLTSEVALLMLATTIPIACLSVALGMRINDQQRAASWGSPLLFAGVITAAMKTLVEISPWMLPTGAAPELIDAMVFGNSAAVALPITVAVALLYCVVALALLLKSIKVSDAL